jgi:hypothetical protein
MTSDACDIIVKITSKCVGPFYHKIIVFSVLGPETIYFFIFLLGPINKNLKG